MPRRDVQLARLFFSCEFHETPRLRDAQVGRLYGYFGIVK